MTTNGLRQPSALSWFTGCLEREIDPERMTDLAAERNHSLKVSLSLSSLAPDQTIRGEA
jgi:hypothetical protein